MRRLIIICLLALSAVALVAVAPGVALAKKSGPTPVIQACDPDADQRRQAAHDPREVTSGPAAKGNTIIFRRTGVAPRSPSRRRASRTQAGGARARRGGAPAHGQEQPSAPDAPQAARAGRQVQRLHLAAALAGRDRRRRGRGGGGGGTTGACGTGSDYDGDLLSNSLEIAIGTDPCLRDTDKDGIEDGYEYESALDLNHYRSTRRCPTRASAPIRTRSTRATRTPTTTATASSPTRSSRPGWTSRRTASRAPAGRPRWRT